MPAIPNSTPETIPTPLTPTQKSSWISPVSLAVITVLVVAIILATALYLHYQDIGPAKLPMAMTIGGVAILIGGFVYYKYRRHKEKENIEPVKAEPKPRSSSAPEPAAAAIMDIENDDPLDLPPPPPPPPQKVHAQHKGDFEALLQKQNWGKQELADLLILLKGLKFSLSPDQKAAVLKRLIEQAKESWQWFSSEYSAILEELIIHQGQQPTSSTGNADLDKKIKECLRKQQNRTF